MQSSILTNEVNEPLIELTVDTQFQALENAVTPLCRVPYDKQLNLKQQWTNSISREFRSRVHNLKIPVRLPKIYPISPSVGIH